MSDKAKNRTATLKKASAKRLKKHRANPANYAKYIENIASIRALDKGCMVDSCPVDKERRIEIYRQARLLNLRDGPRSWHVDHIHELHMGGSHSSANLQILSKADHKTKTKLNRVRR